MNYMDSKNFNKNGFFIKKAFLSKNEIKKIKDLFYDVASKYIKLGKFKNFDDPKLNKTLIQFRKKNPKLFGEMYDSFNLNSQLRSIFFSKKFINFFSKILNVSKNFIFINGFMLRLDAPNDKRNSLKWHQDSPYYQMSYPKYNSGVCWISLTNNDKKNGSLVFIPKSHVTGFHKVKSQKKSHHHSEQYKLDIKDKKNLTHLSSKTGDAAIFHMNIKHKSGNNTSNKIRMVLGCRFHDMNEKFNNGKEIYYFNKTKKPYLF